MAISQILNNSLASGVPGTSKLPAGSVLQVVQATNSTFVSTTAGGTNYVDTGLSATITPSSASSKILVFVNHSKVRKTGDTVINFRIVRGGSDIWTQGALLDTGSTAQVDVVIPLNYLDSPSTASAITYKTQFASSNGSIYGPSTITLMEIAA